METHAQTVNYRMKQAVQYRYLLTVVISGQVSVV